MLVFLGCNLEENPLPRHHFLGSMLVFIYPPGNARSHGTHVTLNGKSWKIIGHSKVPANGEGGYVDRSPEVVARP